jgi:hypothetical protein
MPVRIGSTRQWARCVQSCAAQTLNKAKRDVWGPFVPTRQVIVRHSADANLLATSGTVNAGGKSSRRGLLQGRAPLGFGGGSGTRGSSSQTTVLASNDLHNFSVSYSISIDYEWMTLRMKLLFESCYTCIASLGFRNARHTPG